MDKAEIRDRVWNALRSGGHARFPFPIEGRIPNFDGAEAAVERLTAMDFYRRAATLKCNPDSPQRPLRLRALRDGKVVFMAVPRLREERCFIRLDPERIAAEDLGRAATISGSTELGEPVHPRDMPGIDLISAGSVAVSRGGARIGKGGGYSDLEFAIGIELGLITDRTVVVTTVHDAQLVDWSWRAEPHDIPLDWIFTPTRSIACSDGHPRPAGICWERVDGQILERIPVLRSLQR